MPGLERLASLRAPFCREFRHSAPAALAPQPLVNVIVHVSPSTKHLILVFVVVQIHAPCHSVQTLHCPKARGVLMSNNIPIRRHFRDSFIWTSFDGCQPVLPLVLLPFQIVYVNSTHKERGLKRKSACGSNPRGTLSDVSVFLFGSGRICWVLNARLSSASLRRAAGLGDFGGDVGIELRRAPALR